MLKPYHNSIVLINSEGSDCIDKSICNSAIEMVVFAKIYENNGCTKDSDLSKTLDIPIGNRCLIKAFLIFYSLFFFMCPGSRCFELLLKFRFYKRNDTICRLGFGMDNLCVCYFAKY